MGLNIGWKRIGSGLWNEGIQPLTNEHLSLTWRLCNPGCSPEIREPKIV